MPVRVWFSLYGFGHGRIASASAGPADRDRGAAIVRADRGNRALGERFAKAFVEKFGG